MSIVYLIPSQLSEEATEATHPYTLEAIGNCQVIFAENQRTTRRFFKALWRFYRPGEEIVIDNFKWYDLDNDQNSFEQFRSLLKENQNIAIVSEAGCPGVADPGQEYVAIAQELGIRVVPLVGPSSILLALMASGMNGQHFEFHGYLPVDAHQRIKSLKELESSSKKKNCTHIFIETPYRNNQLLDAILKNCQPGSRLCIAVDVTGKEESILTRTIQEWKKNVPELHKRLVIFLLMSSR